MAAVKAYRIICLSESRQTPNSDTAASSWSAKSPQGARVGASAPPEASGASPPNGFFKGASSRGVAAKEAEADGEPPPGGIEMKMKSTKEIVQTPQARSKRLRNVKKLCQSLYPPATTQDSQTLCRLVLRISAPVFAKRYTHNA
ncbi:Protein of unknown function [Gryllus bimaculatus]|nr:Protein of unknown function [Gryllus bimaculatus]